jgi:tetratricopeptide (TPR) repeat protein
MIQKYRRSCATLLALLALSCEPQTWDAAMQAGDAALQRGQYQEAEQIFSAAVHKAEGFGLHDRRVAVTLSRLGQTYSAQGKFVEAEPVYLAALQIYQEVHGENHLDVAAMLNNLGVLHRKHGQYADAQRLLTRALSIKEQLLGTDHLDVALALSNLAALYLAQEDWGPAAKLLARALAVREKRLSPDHPDLVKNLDDYAGALRKLNRDLEAGILERRAHAIRTKPTS